MPSKMRKSRFSTLPTDPIGVLPDGTINIVSPDDPPFQPRVLNHLGVEIDHSLIDQTGDSGTVQDAEFKQRLSLRE